MTDDRTPDHRSVVAHAVREYLVTGQEAVLDGLTVNQRMDAERQITAHREAIRREAARGDTARSAPLGAQGPAPRYWRQLLYILVGFFIALACFWGVYALPKMV